MKVNASQYRKIENIGGQQMVDVSDINIVVRKFYLHGWIAFHLIELQILAFCAYEFLNTVLYNA